MRVIEYKHTERRGLPSYSHLEGTALAVEEDGAGLRPDDLLELRKLVHDTLHSKFDDSGKRVDVDVDHKRKDKVIESHTVEPEASADPKIAKVEKEFDELLDGAKNTNPPKEEPNLNLSNDNSVSHPTKWLKRMAIINKANTGKGLIQLLDMAEKSPPWENQEQKNEFLNQILIHMDALDLKRESLVEAITQKTTALKARFEPDILPKPLVEG